MTKRKRSIGGGWRQFAVADDPSDIVEREGEEEVLAVEYLFQWAWGTTAIPSSAALCCRLARRALQQGVRTPLMEALALGHNDFRSRVDANATRCLRNALVSWADPRALLTSVAGSSVDTVALPHTVFATIAKRSPVEFLERLGADRAGVRRFWEQLLETREGQAMALLHGHVRGKSLDELEMYIPLAIHEDSAPCSKNDSAVVRDWFSLLARGGTDLQCRYLITSYIKSKHATMNDKSWPLVLDSFERLHRGTDDAGEPLVNLGGTEWRAILLFSCMDMEWYVNDLGFSSWSSTDICAFCPANRTDYDFKNMRRCAPWRTRMYSNTQFMAHLRKEHPLSTYAGFSVFFPRLDSMHVQDYNGNAANVCGNALWLLLTGSGSTVPGDSREARLQTINAKLRSYYTRNKVKNRIGDLRIGNILKPGKMTTAYPFLAGKRIKAANTRALCPFVLELCQLHRDVPPSPACDSRLAALEALVEYYQITYRAGMFLTDLEKQKLSNAVLKMGAHLQALHLQALEADQLLWNIRPKAHYGQHLVSQARLINPKLLTCYLPESLTGKVANVVKAVLNGQSSVHHGVPRATMERWAVALHCSTARG